MMKTTYGFGTNLNLPYDEAIQRVKDALKTEGFGVLTEIDVCKTMREGYIPGAKLIPLSSLASRARELDPTKEIIAVCRSGNRSKSATLILQRAGFTRVSSMAGGMISWTRQHFPVSYT